VAGRAAAGILAPMKLGTGDDAFGLIAASEGAVVAETPMAGALGTGD